MAAAAALLINFIALSLIISISPSVSSSNILSPNQTLADNQTLVSSDARFALGFFSPPGSTKRYIGVWYNTVTVQTVFWVANRAAPVNDSTGILMLTPTGTLIVTTTGAAAASAAPLWSSTPSSAALTNPTAKLLDNGNLVVADGNGNFAWQSFDHPTDTLVSGMKLGVDFKKGINRTFAAWTSASDPAPGPITAFMDVNGDPEILMFRGSTKIWRTGPWDGHHFSGVPETSTYRSVNFTFIDNEDEVYYSFVTDPSIISRLLINASGIVQRALWIPTDNVWNFFWYSPKDPCDQMYVCGPYGSCNPNDSPMCSCVQGFTPRYPQNWALRDGTGGCRRKTALDCRNGTDGFVTVRGTKLPEASNCTVDRGLKTLSDCSAACLKSCSCVAYAAADVTGPGGGTGCVFWHTEIVDLRLFTDQTGQDLYVRVAAADLGSTNKNSRKTNVVAAIATTIVLGIILLMVLAYLFWLKKRKRTAVQGFSASAMEIYNDESREGNDLELPLFDLDTIASSTDNFSMANRLGEGGFGPVYKGNLGGQQEIAVKRLAKTSVQGIEEFKNEVNLIAKLQHRNLVRLLGCCIRGPERMLIYEYMPNGSLDTFIFNKTRSALVDWRTRYSIIQGISRGLVYLHHDSRLRIIHRDLKASNILLDLEMNPKISDFGMARIFGGDETEANTRKVVGTYGYMSPEYAMDGVFSVKSDVFSFGVLVLEIISGRKNRGAYHDSLHANLLGHAWSLWNEGNSLHLVDESIGHTFDSNQVIKCIRIGLLCVQQRPEERPLMSSVVLMLGSDAASLPIPKHPGFVAHRVPGPFETDSSSSKQDTSTHNDMTFTVLEAR